MCDCGFANSEDRSFAGVRMVMFFLWQHLSNYIFLRNFADDYLKKKSLSKSINLCDIHAVICLSIGYGFIECKIILWVRI